ncbi:MAG TPA: glycosyltransferase [Methylophaga aminisulfidivorans]|uniref:glycosyltransferase family 4 protein n=1 Tax=Methylophaga TaxID=40222 RepID=UPI00175B5FAD|nr:MULTISPECIES: glycosyltransferase family 4 protein [Methylophaga]HIC47874.1 glycosyltransferase [Methylophaga sp.]HIM39299.1 glycosyltransferase [Methylophaga aminisulfidivorans]
MKVLILAEQCNPDWPSLPGFSFALANDIAKLTSVVLVTHIRNKENIESLTNKAFEEIVYIDTEVLAKPLHKLSKLLIKIGVGGLMTNMALKYPPYILFEKKTYEKLKPRIESGEFDVIHRISPVSPTLPSYIPTRINTPFILGPLNGALPWPKQYTEEIKKEREIISHVRNIYKYFPYYKKSFQSSRVILSAFRHADTDIPKEERYKIKRYNELGVDTSLYVPNKHDVSNNHEKTTFLFVGRLVPYKGAHVLINAFIRSQLLRSNSELIIVGDGPEREYLAGLIANNHLQNTIHMVGWKSQSEVAEYMNNADIFAFPTIREVGGNVIIEALASGLPCIVPDYGGPSELVDETIGIKIPLSDKDTFLNNYIKSMESLSEDKTRIRVLSKSARERALSKHSWSARAQAALKIYESLK